jgi:hypothetical protein
MRTGWKPAGSGNPELKLTRLVAGVLALFEHGDDSDLDRNGGRLRAGDGGKRNEGGEDEDAELH